MTKEIHIIQGKENLLEYVKGNKAALDLKLQQHGALLLKGFQIYAVSEFQAVSEVICHQLFDYKYGSTPRIKLGGEVYTSTEYPPEHTIPQHNENAYTDKWPSKILFYCAVEPGVGGETPIANSHEVYNLIPKKIRDRFIRKGVMYTRNYGSGMDLTWQQAFQTESKKDVEAFCQSHGIDYEWLGSGKLRTKQVCQAILEHPESKMPVWFNQAHLFHQSANAPLLQEFFKSMDPLELPRNAFYGDGTHFAEEDLNEIREAYKQAEQKFSWQKGDLMLLDNVLYSHGREPFKGERRILVSMGE